MKKPRIDEQAVVADGAVVLGDVTIEKDVSIWYNAVIRGDANSISIGEGTNIQDLAVLHVDADASLAIGKNVTIGHGAILHGCTIKDQALIGMGAIVLNGAVIGKGSMIAAGALVLQNTVVPDGALYMGNPAKFRRMLTEEELTANLKNAANYIKESKDLNN
ncbi:gamma carbonic anhydrase family protein [Clostridiaceae bacterium AF42-6]|nr:gamma carbonic anhydrase family protein [Clostridiaceae bacterium AF42-6]RHP52144.1 gamma carbonic anhydrase family protein [Clostridiaceae bacterium AF31-3BH]RHQ24958.1 gamma carbonic anhydrase family protein [Clostridiaceae bacterium AF29-16BH]